MPRRDPAGPEADDVDYRARPELYRVGVGEQGAFHVQPYKDEILPHWRFRTPDLARESAAKIASLFEAYKSRNDFVGMDMARKYLQMGYTQSRRYANHRGGRKFDPATGEPLDATGDPSKAESAAIFKEAWARAKDDPEYLRRKADHRDRHERSDRNRR